MYAGNYRDHEAEKLHKIPHLLQNKDLNKNAANNFDGMLISL